MSNPSIGYAVLPIIPSLKGAQATIQRELNGMAPAVGASAGSQMGNAFTRAASTSIQTLANVTATALTAGVGVGTAALVKGWQRFTTIENSIGALEISLGSADAAAGLLGETLEVVRGTPFNLDQFAAAAQQMAGMSIEADKIPKYLEAIGEAAATQGGRASEMAGRLTTVFGQIAASGQVQLADVWRISDTGVNALGILANHFGVTRDAMKEMISQGAVPAGEALDALAKGILEGSDGPAGATVALAGTMEKLRQTTTGAVGGISPALARLGAGFVEAFSPSIITSANGLTDAIDKLTESAPEWAERLAGSPAVQTVVGLFERLPDLIDEVPGALDGIAPAAGAALAGLSAMGSGSIPIIGKFLPAINPVAAALVGLVAATPEARQALGDVMEEVGPLVMELGDRLIPIVEDLSEIAGEVLPPALRLAGDGLGVVLNLAIPLVDVVGDLTGVLAEHEEIVLAVAAAWALVKVQAVGAAAWQGLSAGASAATAFATRLAVPTAAIEGLGSASAVGTGKVGLLSGAMTGGVSAGAAFGGILAGVAAGAMGASYALDKLHESGARDASEWLSGLGEMSKTSLTDAQLHLSDINAQVQDLMDQLNSGDTNAFDDEHLAAEIKALSEESERLTPALSAAARGVTALRDASGLTLEQIEAMAKAAGIDLVGAFDDAGNASPELQAALDAAGDAAKAMNVDLNSIEMSPEQIEQLKADAEELEKAITSAMDKASASVQSYGDILQLKDEPVDPRQFEAAEKAVEKAKEQVAEAEKATRESGLTADEQERAARALADAKDNLVDANRSLADLRASDSPLNGEKITKFYEDRLAEVQGFQANLRTAMEEGFDAGLISRLIQAGPEAAGPVLEQLVANSTDSFVEMVNAAEAELSDLSTQATEMARLTAMAVENHSESGQQMVRDLAAAQRISLGQLQDDGTATIETLAYVAKLSVEEYRRIAEEFGLELADLKTEAQQTATEIAQALQGVLIDAGGGSTGQWFGSGSPPGRASGGPVEAGWTGWVGERGPELLTVPAPGYVFDHATSMRMLAGAKEQSKQAPARRRGSSDGPVAIVTAHDGQSVADMIDWKLRGR